MTQDNAYGKVRSECQRHAASYLSVAAEHMEVFEDLGHPVRFVRFLGRSSRNAEGSLARNDEGNPSA